MMITLAVSVEASEIADQLRPHATLGEFAEATQSDEWTYLGSQLGDEFLRQYEFDLHATARRAVEAHIASLIPSYAKQKGMTNAS